MALPPVLLELTASAHPFHRFTPFQLMNLTPTLLVDSVSEPIPVGQLAQILLRGLNDPSVDVQIEAMKAVRSIILESFTGKEREQVGWHLVLEAFKVGQNSPNKTYCWRSQVLGVLLMANRPCPNYHQTCCPTPWSLSST